VDILEKYHRPDVYQTEGFVLPADCATFDEYGEQLHGLRNDVLILDGWVSPPA
jgi:hypothetical protein